MSNYWQLRAAELEGSVQMSAEESIKRSIKAYNKAADNIKAELARTMSNYSELTGLTQNKAKEYISKAEQDKTVDELKKLLAKARSEKEKQDITVRINAKSYGYRMTRLEQLQEKIYTELKKASFAERAASERQYKEAIKKGYYSTLDDMAYSGMNISFSEISTDTVNKIINSSWSGKQFSKRIWDNTTRLADEACNILASGVASGASINDMAEQLDRIAGKGVYNATRLIRTESNYFHNQGTHKEYEDAGIKKYKYLATLDTRTSEICRNLDGQVFEAKKAQAGENYPPMHPFCRSVTVQADFETNGQRIARDPETEKNYYVDGNMNYNRWYESLSEHQKTLIDNYGNDSRTFKRYMNVLEKENMPKSLAEFQDLKYNNSGKWDFIKLDYKRQNYLINHPEAALPNAKNVAADNRKFTGYLFSPDNPKGYAKGKAFTSRLGYDENNYMELKKAILQSATKYPVTLKGNNEHGDLYEQKIVLYGKKDKPANVVVGWIQNDFETKMTSAYIKEIK